MQPQQAKDHSHIFRSRSACGSQIKRNNNLNSCKLRWRSFKTNGEPTRFRDWETHLFSAVTRSAYHLNGIFGGFFWTNGTAPFLTKKTERIEPYHLIRSFGCKCFPAPLSSKARIMKAKVKHKNRRPKLKSFSPWVLQLCCKKSVDSSRENKTTVTSRTVWNSKDSSLKSAVMGIAVLSEIAWHW